MPPRLRIAALAALALGAGLTAPSQATEQAGVAAAVRGEVLIAERTGAIGKKAQSGEQVFLGNAVTSGPNSGMQIILLDETTFTIGPNSQIVIDEFVYDPKTSAGKMTATVTKGVFRFVTGKMAKEQPGAMQVRLPTGTIGIRGTTGLGQTGNGGPQQVILLGPGGNTDTNNRGGLDLSNGASIVALIRAGFGSTLLPNGNWGPPEKFDQATIERILGLLRSVWTGGAPSDGDNQSGSQTAGTSQYDAQQRMAALFGVYDLVYFAQLIGVQETQQQIRERTLAMGGSGPIVDGIATFAQLRTVNSGSAFWSQTDVPLRNSFGFLTGSTYSLFMDINFGARTVGGGNSRADISGGGTLPAGTIPWAAQSYAGKNGPATFTFFNDTSYNYVDCGGTCRSTLNATALNSNGIIANTLSHTLTLRSTGSEIAATGNGTTGPRQPSP